MSTKTQTRWVATLVVCLSTFVSAIAGPRNSTAPAGTVIPNTAKVTYTDGGNVAVAQSNTVVVNQQLFESLTLTQDQTLLSQPGSSFTFVHTLTNTGNADATYTVLASQAATGTSFTPTTLKVYQDVNGNGVLDSGDTEITATTQVGLALGQSAAILVVGTVPTSAAPGNSSTIVLTATSTVQNVVVTDTDKVLVAGADVRIQKSASVTSAKGNDVVPYTLSVTNAGASPANPVSVKVDGSAVSYVLVKDVIPANSTFSAIVNAGGTTPLYHLARQPDPAAFVSAAPADSTLVDMVAFATPSLAPGAAVTVSFSVAVHANASGTLTNAASVAFADGTAQEKASNSVVIQLPQFVPDVGFYQADFAQRVSVGTVGGSLRVQGSASSCNLNPQVAEQQQIRIVSSITNDQETFVAVETGANTGVFRVLGEIQTKNASTNPVVPGNNILEVLPNERLTASLLCSGKAATATLLLDPSGVVFDSKTNAPISGATVVLIDVSGVGNGGQAGKPATVFEADGTTAAPSSIVTSADGRFKFPLVAPSTYQLQVSVPSGLKVPSALSPAQLPAGHTIDINGSYLRAFDVSAALGTVVFDVPADEGPINGLFVEKTASKQSAQVGDFVDYTLKLHNGSSLSLDDVTVTDTLPRGFRYFAGTARLNGNPVAEPKSSGGSTIFNVGTMAANATLSVTYRVEIGAGTATGKNVNYAVAQYGRAVSNRASATVYVDGGVFTDRGYVVGKVTSSCDDGSGNITAYGVPGVRIFMEDGTYALTDPDGNYSFYGLRAQTHVLKIDGYSVPRGSSFISNSNRHSGDGASAFVDLKFGELRRADFSLRCTSKVQQLLKAYAEKRKATGSDSDALSLVSSQLQVQPSAPLTTSANTGTVSGVISQGGAGSVPTTLANASTTSDAAKIPVKPGTKTEASKSAEHTSSALPEDVLKSLDGKLGFVNLKDGDVSDNKVVNVWVKGPTGGTDFNLLVNGEQVSSHRVGTRKNVPGKNIAVWQFIGVELRVGRNELKTTMVDPFGNERTASVAVVVPDEVAKVKLSIPQRPVPADGFTSTKISVSLFDSHDVPIRYRMPITLEVSAGKWLVKDLDENRPGIQTIVDNGHAEFELLSPVEPIEARIHVACLQTSADGVMSYIPELRPMTAAGVMEYQLNFQHMASNSIQSVNGVEGFEEQVHLFSASDSNFQAGARSAMYLKGKILGENLLTMAYDSNRASGERLFRDIQPDQFYPVYGDSSTRGYDAQSTSKLYMRVDNGKSYLIYGDYQTADQSYNQRTLTAYNRSLTGMKQHYEGDRLKVTTFATYDSFRQVVEEFAANGTSGPYTFKYSNGVENSEKVELLVRDRNQQALVLKTELQTRFQDYEFEPFTGRLLFKSPIPTLDEDRNPVYIRVTYEVDQGGQRFWAGGFDSQYQLTNRWTVGAIAVGDGNPQDPSQLYGFHSSFKLPMNAVLSGEIADTHHELLGSGIGYRVQYKQDSKRLKTDIYMGRTAKEFQNESSMLGEGRGEAGGRIEFLAAKATRITGEFLRSEDTKTGGTIVGARFAVEQRFAKRFKFRVGLRHSEQGMAQSQPLIAGTTVTPDSLTAVSGKLTVDLPRSFKTTVGVEFEQDVAQMDKHAVSVDAITPIPHGKLYARHQFMSSLGGDYSLNSMQTRMATQIGIDTEVFKHAHLFSEYREHDELTNRNSEAAIGLRNTWKLNKELAFTGSFESIRAFNGAASSGTPNSGTSSTGSVNSLAFTGGVEFNRADMRGSARFEYRNSTAQDSYLTSVSFGKKVSSQWTLLSRNVLMLQNSKTSQSTGDQTQARFQFGGAYRGSESSRWDALSLLEYRVQNATGASATKQSLAIFSTHVNYQPLQGLSVTTRYATKWNLDHSNGLKSDSLNQLFSFHVTKDLSRRFDIGLISSLLTNRGVSLRQQNLGAEIGFQLKQNLWLSTGYNFLGFFERDLPGGSDARQGAFVRLRFKFDENILKVPGRTQFKQKAQENPEEAQSK